MSAALVDIRQAMADAIKPAIPNASPYVMGNATPPCAQILRGDYAYDQAMQGGVHELEMRIRVYVADTLDQLSAALLDRYMDPDGDFSVKSALESDSSLGGLISDLHVTGSSGETVYNREQGGPLLGSELQVTLWI